MDAQQIRQLEPELLRFLNQFNNCFSRKERSAQDRSKAKPDEVVQTPVARLSGRAASCATNADAVRAAEIVLTHRVIWKFAD